MPNFKEFNFTVFQLNRDNNYCKQTCPKGQSPPGF